MKMRIVEGVGEFDFHISLNFLDNDLSSLEKKLEKLYHYIFSLYKVEDFSLFKSNVTPTSTI